MSDPSPIPLVVIEGVLVLGGALLFGWWQLRSVRRDQRLWAERRRREAQEREREAQEREQAGTVATAGHAAQPAVTPAGSAEPDGAGPSPQSNHRP